MSQPTAADKRFFVPAELADGWRLACGYFPVGSCVVRLPSQHDPLSGYRIVSAYDVPPFPVDTRETAAGSYGMAVDIGTTTIALELIDLRSGRAVARHSVLNSQRSYGADVLSRIRASGDGFGNDLRQAVQDDIVSSVRRLLATSNVPSGEVSLVTVAANTAMIYLLLGLTCETLATAPFIPARTVFDEKSFNEIFGDDDIPLLRCPVRIIPCISAFIGGDVVAGLAALDLGLPATGLPAANGRKEAVLFLDLGTNAEMVLVSGDSFWCASAASGPAFEGGCISCGTGSIAGAVSAVRLEGNRFIYSLIGDDEGLSDNGDTHSAAGTKPAGLCGSGLLDLVACALESGLLRQDGSLAPVCANTGIVLDASAGISLSVQDIRELQLAKSAIRSGLSVLLAAAGLQESDVARIHLAGGFGRYLKESSALTVGLLPLSFAGKIHVAGNTALAGAVRSLTDTSMTSRLERILSNSRVVQLADDPGFAALFIDYLAFP